MSQKEWPEVNQVGPLDPEKKNSPIIDAPLPGEAKTWCWFNGVQYSPWALICSAGNLLQCGNDGRWRRIGSC